uniref:Twinfilin-1 n=1 Tax=Dracunculus medinensis TaxID=318479 RepID=A0A0N4ULT4_DRAME
LLPECIDSFEPCFILFRIDEPGWLFISFADDRASVREKMVLAATTATFKAEFGQSNIKYEYHVTNKKDLSLEAFEKWLEGKSENAPMSEIEIELNNAQKEQNSLMPSVLGVLFPMDQNVEEELKKLHDRKINYVQMSVDTLNEAIKLEVALRIESVEIIELQVIPYDKPRYHFYRFSHNLGVFIYSMPSSGCTIKEKMLYSSCKQPFLQSAFSIEIDSREKLSLETLLDYVRPPVEVKEKAFAKPPGPNQRGGRRVIKTNV